jgi:hypothetical protein
VPFIPSTNQSAQFVGEEIRRSELLLRPVKAISRSESNDGSGADSSLSRGDPCWSALRPIKASKGAACYVRSTSTPAVRCAQVTPVVICLRRRKIYEPGGLIAAIREGAALVDTTTADPAATCRIGADWRDAAW